MFIFYYYGISMYAMAICSYIRCGIVERLHRDFDITADLRNGGKMVNAVHIRKIRSILYVRP